MNYEILYLVFGLLGILIIFLLLFAINYVYTNNESKKMIVENNLKKETTMYLKYYLNNSEIVVNNVDNIDWNFGKIIKLIRRNKEFKMKMNEFAQTGKEEDFNIQIIDKKVQKNLKFSFKKYSKEAKCIILKVVYKRDYQPDLQIDLDSSEKFKAKYLLFKKPQGVMFYINIIGFNLINQRYGRISGDYVLSIFKQRVKDFENRKIYPFYLGKDHLALFINKKITDTKSLKLAKKVLKSLKQPIDISGLNIELMAEIGICSGKYNNFDSFIQNSYIACEQCRKVNQPLVIYNNSLKSEEMIAKYCKEEIDLIMAKKRIETLYNPLYSIKKNKVIGYFSKVDLNNKNINFDKIKIYADQIGAYDKLIGVNFRSKLTDFMKNRPNRRLNLLIEMKLEDVNSFKETLLSDSTFSGCKTIICLDIRKGFESIYRNPEILDDINKIINERIEVALIINENIFYDYEVFLKIADYIIINSDLVKGINDNIINKNKVKSIIKKSKEYDVDFIARDISEYLELETLLKLDIDLMSGTYFAPWQNVPSEIEYSKTKKLTYILKENFYK